MSTEDEKAARDFAEAKTDFIPHQGWLEEGFLAGIAHQKGKEAKLLEELLYFYESCEHGDKGLMVIQFLMDRK